MNEMIAPYMDDVIFTEGLEVIEALNADNDSIDTANLVRGEDGELGCQEEIDMGPITKTKQEDFEDLLSSQCESLETLQEEAVTSINWTCTSCFDVFNECELGNDLDRCPTCGEHDVMIER